MANPAVTNPAVTTHSTVQLRRAVASSFIGSVIEYYDFLLYATAAAVVFGKVFFAALDPLAATVASFGTFAAGYLARPLGGILFGHFGDRIGRKKMLVTTMTLMGVASFLIGALPTYGQIGIWAPVALVTLRVLQGVAVGGEWGGAVLMSAEHATSRRGLWASFTNAGAPCGMVLSTVVLTVTAAASGERAFLAWGWRVPFLLSILLLGIGLFIRLKVEETPVFAAAERSARVPLFDDEMNCVLLARTHPLATATSLSTVDLNAVPFLFPARETFPPVHDVVMHEFDRCGARPRIDSTYEGVVTIWAVAAQGLGWALGLREQAADPPMGLKAIPLRDFRLAWGGELLYRKDESRASILTVIDTIVSRARELFKPRSIVTKP